jgi:hypothetical protein
MGSIVASKMIINPRFETIAGGYLCEASPAYHGLGVDYLLNR